MFLSLAPSAPAFDGGWQVQVGGWATGALCGAAPARAPGVSLRSLKKKDCRSIEVRYPFAMETCVSAFLRARVAAPHSARAVLRVRDGEHGGRHG